jgi:hypothetical protein
VLTALYSLEIMYDFLNHIYPMIGEMTFKYNDNIPRSTNYAINEYFEFEIILI